MKIWVLCFILVITGACAMELPREEFLDLAELVVVVKMQSVASWEEPASGMLLLSNCLLVEETLRGKAASDTVIVKNYANVTGCPELEIGVKYVMFLQWNEELQSYLLVNGVQGCWQILDGDLLGGMGRQRSLEKLREFFQKNP